MKKIVFATGLSVVMMGCSLLSPYQITFTTKENEPINPMEDTLDLVVSSPALTYVSSYKCGDEDEVILLPVLNDEMIAQMAQYIDLDFLADQSPETLCEINVTAFDRSTTSTSSKSISVYMYSAPMIKAKENEFCGGIAAIQCEDGFTCKLSGDYPDAGGSCIKKVDEKNETVIQNQLKAACIEADGEWNECTDPNDTLCTSGCKFKEAEETNSNEESKIGVHEETNTDTSVTTQQ